MPSPDTETWEQVAKGFYERWQFPLCLGAIDGKHIRLKAPANSGSQYFNYKGHHSIVLMAICDAKSRFIVIDVGAYGSSSDGGIFQNSNFYELLRTNKLHLPVAKHIPNTNIEVPYVFVCDEAFPLLENVMRPFPRRQLSDKQRIFNYRLSRARKQIECSFGHICSMWRVLRNAMELNVDFAIDIVKAICILHNYIQAKEPERIRNVDPINLDIDTPFLSTTLVPTRAQSRDGKAVRNAYMDYFVSPTGSLSWQYSL